ncbi:MAG: hypothetical protein AUJ52_13960 [Elusimicrobia bacterium CG1_02_63_36]|nr:MAG: hypothetical protein AUJ52_13960 [Elusimicrobia bacterium CG1_02_63_36]
MRPFGRGSGSKTLTPLRGALIGFGQVAEKAHVPAYRRDERFVLAAVVDSSAERRTAAENLVFGLKAYASLDELYAAEPALDFVDIATPPHLHAAQALDALERGLHVLCEKPLTFSTAELNALEAAAKKNRRSVIPIHNWKYAPLFLKLAELLDLKTIGKIRHTEWHVLRTKPAVTAAAKNAKGNWRTDPRSAGGGILMDHGWHAFYLIGGIARRAPNEVHGVLRGPKGAEEEAVCLVTYPESTASVRLTWRADTRRNHGAVYGEKGRIDILDDRLSVIRGAGDPGTHYVFPEPLSAGSAHPEWFAGSLDEFHAAISGEKRARSAFEEARDCRFLLDRLYA